jgi:DNA-binding NarL/FixJ family response regulator
MKTSEFSNADHWLCPQGDRCLFQESGVKKILIVDQYVMRRESLHLMLSSQAKDLQFQSISAPSAAMTSKFDAALFLIEGNDNSIKQSCTTMAEIHASVGEIPVIAVAERENANTAGQLLRFGFRGYICMSMEVHLVIAAIRLVCAGGTFIPECALVRSCSAFKDRAYITDGSSNENDLTHREEQIIDLVREGKPNKIIAHQLCISESTVKVHLQHVMRKLHASNRTEVALRGHEIIF